ncbi:hypothetical protein [Kribbella sp. NPDC050470]
MLPSLPLQLHLADDAYAELFEQLWERALPVESSDHETLVARRPPSGSWV